MAKQRGSSIPASQRYTRRDFQAEFPDDDACLEWLKDRLYPEGIYCEKCERVTKHHKVASRKSYSCQFCGHHVHPTAGTIFNKSSTGLQDWFYAIFLMSQTRCGISAKQLQREVGVTYKTAWRMFHQIRKLLVEDDGPAGESGNPVELDETYIGGRSTRLGQERKAGRPTTGSNKTAVFGVMERGGRVRTRIVTDASGSSLWPLVEAHVLPKSLVYTDEWQPYARLGKMGYLHSRVNHSAKVYVDGDVHTQTIEGFWSLVKNGIRGVYHSVGSAHLQSYLDEYAFRYNHRRDERPMFKIFLERAYQVRCGESSSASPA
jgi:transposase